MTVERTVTIDPGFEGLPGVGHGGYVAGLAAAGLGAASVTVALRRPTPIGVPLQLRVRGDLAVLLDGDAVLAEARPAPPVDVAPPAVVVPDAAARASAGYRGFRDNPYPGCLCCGPARARGEGLRIFAGPLGDGSSLAAPWTPEPRMGIAPVVQAPFVWAALDCPGYWALRHRHPDHPDLVTGRMTVSLLGPVRAGEPHVVQAWPIERRGRRFTVGTAVLSPDARPLAIARSDWIEVGPPRGGVATSAR